MNKDAFTPLNSILFAFAPGRLRPRKCKKTVPLQGEKPQAELRFTEHLIMDGYAYAHGIAAADLDGDGDLDLTSADATDHDKLYWFENDGSGSFKRHLIQEEDPERLERHRIGDIDGDGDPDVAIVKNKFGDLLWFENSGTPGDGKLWPRHIITRGKSV